jgi:hypothetical protein
MHCKREAEERTMSKARCCVSRGVHSLWARQSSERVESSTVAILFCMLYYRNIIDSFAQVTILKHERLFISVVARLKSTALTWH